MDRLHIDMSVISSAAVIAPLYWAEPSVALRLAQQLNDTAAEWAAGSPERIIGSFVLPLQDMDLALKELNRATNPREPQRYRDGQQQEGSVFEGAQAVAHS